MTIEVDYKKNVWLSKEYLVGNGVSGCATRQWLSRNICKYKYNDKRIFIDYDTIPEPTRKKLPCKAVLIYDHGKERADSRQQDFLREIRAAYDDVRVGYWRNEILKISDNRFTNERLMEFARKASVFERILSIYHGEKGYLEPLYKAYLSVYPDGYTMKNRFCMALTRAEKEGVLSVAVNHSCLNRGKVIHGDDKKYYASYILSHSKCFEVSEAYDKFRTLCDRENLKCPSLKWFWTYRKNNKNDIDRGRLGASGYEALNGTYAKIIPALNAGDQWQIDGWEIPVYYRKRRDDGSVDRFSKCVLFAVMDAHSRKIIGYHIAESENTETILKGLEKAIKNTGTLPYEIVSDNHSFNKTKAAGSLKDDIAGLGVTWTVDSNPRRKAIVERSFLTLGNKHFKNQFGYIGQGIRSKKEGGITQPELMDVYMKSDNTQVFEQVLSTVLVMINDYNDSIIKKYGDTPNSRYEKANVPTLSR